MSIEVLRCMPGCSVQDTGRVGYRRIGVGCAGALDDMALAMGNILLGNPAGSAAIEVLLFPLEVRFLVDCAFAVTGSPGNVYLDDQPLPPSWRSTARGGQTLRMDGSCEGGIGYLCLGGTLDVTPVLNSSSLDLKGNFGGFNGRMLKAGDRLRLLNHHGATNHSSFGALPYGLAGGEEIRVLLGFEFEALPAKAQKHLLDSPWIISRQSNRIGFRLEGPELQLEENIELLSYAFLPGLIQLPPNGQPIVMLADAQTSGGYPRLGSVIPSDLGRVAQTPPGKAIRLRSCSLEEAQEAANDKLSYLRKLSQLRETVCP